MYKTYWSSRMNYRLRWTHPNSNPCPRPSQSHSFITVSLLGTQFNRMRSQIFSVYTPDPEIWLKKSVPIWLLNPGFYGACHGGCSQQWMASWSSLNTPRGGLVHALNSHKNSSSKRLRKKTALFRTDVLFLFPLYPCSHELVRRYHWQGERALDRNSGDVGWRVSCHFSFINDPRQVPGLSFPICKMRGSFSTTMTIPLFVCVCMNVYICICMRLAGVQTYESTFWVKYSILLITNALKMLYRVSWELDCQGWVQVKKAGVT